MNKKFVLWSAIIHGVFMVAGVLVGGNWANVPPLKGAESTVPLDIAVLADTTAAPISRPKTSHEGALHEANRPVTIPPSLSKRKKPQKKASKKPVVAPKKKRQKRNAPPVRKKEQTDPLDRFMNQIADAKDAAEQKRSPLKNLDSQGGSSETPVTSPDSMSDYGAPTVGPLTISALDRVQKIIAQQWVVPFTLKGGPLKVVVHLTMRRNGTVHRVTVLDRQSTMHHPSYAAAKQSAIKAIERFHTTPLPLPKDRYKEWKEFEFSFVRDERSGAFLG